ncbi:hypothetical protein CN378_18785 [Bacillus sp. AFS015802]|uniref:hypothetical protein n=1 Tax=Bacillus sp. AFS015802 TaxID=2033486 RepID=UPI000BF5CAB2|nr:hypothetical protein [Bacillus sp. AFS015802]PFA63082.1 hypothetical protein CN378_18785 [Bacillus sp. AFS015802]
MTKEKVYPKFWLFATCFTSFWILYGCFILIRDVVIEDSFDWQPLYLIGMMTLMLLQSVQEYKRAKEFSYTDNT